MRRIIILLMAISILQLTSCSRTGKPEDSDKHVTYEYTEYPLERNGIPLHLDCLKVDDSLPENNILMMHGSTYSSHEFDIDYEDYSLVRRLAREGYAVWRLDIAGYGQSGEVGDGLMPDTAYAAEDIRAAMDLIASETGQEKIDLLGWSWGTMTTGLFAGEYPEHLGKLVLYAPILNGLGEADGAAEMADDATTGEAAGAASSIEPFHLTDWAAGWQNSERKKG